MEEEFQKELLKLRKEMWKEIDLIIENTDRRVQRLKERQEWR
ncbi:MAG: hypothetical protein ABIJ18_03265 [archaeon]